MQWIPSQCVKWSAYQKLYRIFNEVLDIHGLIRLRVHGGTLRGVQEIYVRKTYRETLHRYE